MADLDPATSYMFLLVILIYYFTSTPSDLFVVTATATDSPSSAVNRSFLISSAANTLRNSKPPTIFKDPFRGGNNILVICDSYTPQGEPIPSNKRAKAADIFCDPKVVSQVPWFGIEQEYTLLQTNVKWPLGWPVGGYPGPQHI